MRTLLLAIFVTLTLVVVLQKAAALLGLVLRGLNG